MVSTRQRGLKHLDGFVGPPRPVCIAVSRFFPPAQSWTGRATWWFNLPIDKVERLPHEDYYLLGELEKGGYVRLRVPNRFLLANMEHFDTKYRQMICLHLAAYEDNWLVDERSPDRVDFSESEV